MDDGVGEPGSSVPWAPTAALVAGAIAVFADLYATQPMLPLLAKEFGVGAPQAGLTMMGVTAAIAASSGLLGPLSDVLGRKRVMVWSGAALAVATGACAAAPTLGWLVATRALQGLAIPGVSAVAVAYIGDRFERGRAATLVGVYIACTGVGGLVGRVGAGLSAGRLGWHAPFVGLAVLTALATLAMALGLSPDERPAVQPDSADARSSALARPTDGYRAMAAHFREPRLLGAYGVGCFLMFAFVGTFSYLPFKLRGMGLTQEQVGLVYLLYIAGIVVAPFAGHASRGRSAAAMMLAGLAAALAGCAGTLSGDLWAIGGAAVVLCVGMFWVQAIAPAFVNAAAARAKGAAGSLYQTFYYAGAVGGSVLPGVALERWGWPGVVGVCGAALVLAMAASAWCRGAAPSEPEAARGAEEA